LLLVVVAVLLAMVMVMVQAVAVLEDIEQAQQFFLKMKLIQLQ
jgi:hypothetical protein